MATIWDAGCAADDLGLCDAPPCGAALANLGCPAAAGILASEVHTGPYSDYTSNGNTPDCPSPATDPTWT